MHRTLLRGRENVHKRYLVHIADYNLGVLMRALFGVGTPREAVAAWNPFVFVIQAAEAIILVGIAACGVQIAALVITVQEEDTINRYVKYFLAATRPTFWPALAKGVMPTMEHLDAIKRLAPKTLIDVGANKGQFSLMARYLFPEIDIHAFEPLERESRIYQRVVRKPVKLYRTALGRLSGQANFFITSRADSSSLFQPVAAQEVAYGITTERSIKVPVSRLPDILDISALQRPLLLKLDVQGGELDVLEGAQNPYLR